MGLPNGAVRYATNGLRPQGILGQVIRSDTDKAEDIRRGVADKRRRGSTTKYEAFIKMNRNWHELFHNRLTHIRHPKPETRACPT
jgi:hypothetical protein